MIDATKYANATSAELGLHVQVGCEIVAQSGVYPFPEHYAKAIRREFDPDFVPLWVNKLWRTPSGTLTWTGHHILARHVRHPRAGAPLVKNLRMPLHRVYGVKYENPLLEADILDGITDSERDRGVLPRYEPFTGRHFAAMKYAMWARNNKGAARRAKEQRELEAAILERSRKAQNDELAYRRRHDENRLARIGEHPEASRVYVSDTLRKLRETAGMTEAA